MLQFFKALADANRLRVVGLLAHRPYSVEERRTGLPPGPPRSVGPCGLTNIEIRAGSQMLERFGPVQQVPSALW